MLPLSATPSAVKPGLAYGGNVSFISPTVFIVATWIAAICGGVGIAAAFVSAIVGYQLSEKAVTDSNVKIAEAEARTKEAELKLEELRAKVGPRQIKADIFLKGLENKRKSPVEIMFPRDDGEAFLLALQFRDLLRKAGWQASEP